MSKIVAFLCSSITYSYEGWVFDLPKYTSPWPLKRNGDPRERAGRQFYQMVKRFEKLTKEESPFPAAVKVEMKHSGRR